MRIAIGAMVHETNTFTKYATSFDHFWVAKEDEIFTNRKWQDRNSSQGIIKKLREESCDIIPTFFARAIPSGPVERSAYDQIKSSIVDGIHRVSDLDGICLALHGSMFVQDETDPEGDLLEAIRSQIGPNLPITCALDMHATVTDRMVKNADGFAAYKTAPHIDAYETGIRAATLLLAALTTGKRLSVGFTRIPMLLGGEQSETDAPPMNELIGLLSQSEEEESILDASYVLGFPWADSPYAGVGALTVGWADAETRVQELAFELAMAFWKKRAEFHFTTEAYPINQAMEVALSDPGQPIIVSDSGDNPTAGASQDIAHVLKYVVEHQIEPTLIATLADPEAHKRCVETGLGQPVSLKIGRVSPDEPVPFILEQASVERLTTCRGAEIAIVRKNEIQVILSNRRVAIFEPSLILDLGFNPKDFKIIVVKCGYQGPEYKAIAARSILALTPGDTTQNLTDLEYSRTPRPIYPLDRDMKWP